MGLVVDIQNPLPWVRNSFFLLIVSYELMNNLCLYIGTSVKFCSSRTSRSLSHIAVSVLHRSTRSTCLCTGTKSQAENAGVIYKGIVDCGMSTFRMEGIRGVYKGMIPSMLAGVPYVGLQMTFYDQLKVGDTKILLAHVVYLMLAHVRVESQRICFLETQSQYLAVFSQSLSSHAVSMSRIDILAGKSL